MKKYFMIWLRFSLEVFLTIVLFPTILTVSGIWLIYCIIGCDIMKVGQKSGIKTWFEYIKKGIQMNKDFIVNGL